MKKLVIILGAVGMLMVIVSLVVALKFTLDPPPFKGLPFEIELTEAEAVAEMDRLAGLIDPEKKKSFGQLADAASGCIKDTLAKPAAKPVLQALRRYSIAVVAMKNRVESPLIDDRTRDIPFPGPYSWQLLNSGWLGTGNSKATADRWAWYLKHYANAGHPIYAGIDIQPDSWASADLDSLFLSMFLNRSTFRPCYKNRS